MVERLLWLVFNLFWVYPLFFLAKGLSTMYYQQVANAAYHYHYGPVSNVRHGECVVTGAGLELKLRRHKRTTTRLSLILMCRNIFFHSLVDVLAVGIADLIYSTVLQLLMLVEVRK